MSQRRPLVLSSGQVEEISGIDTLLSDELALNTLNGSVTLVAEDGASNIDIIVPRGDLAPLDGPAFTGTVSGVSQSMVGLANVDNTTDANKPVSALQQLAIDNKAIEMAIALG